MTIKKLISVFNNKEYRKINHMALPLILNNVSTMIIGLCDQAMVGRTSLAAFGSVGLIATTINSITGVLGMTSVAFNIIGARYKGEKDYKRLKNNFVVNILISLLVGLVFFLMTLKLGALVLKSMYNLKGEVLNEASIYLNVFSLSLGVNMILFTFSSYFKIINKTKYILYGTVTASISNVVFDYILIFGHFGFPKMGIKGNAIGSILAMMLNILIYLVAIKNDKLFKISNIKFLKTIKETLKISLPLMGQEILESTLLILVINSILSRIGMLEVSVYNLLLTIVSIASMPMYSYSQASLTIISENLGAKNYKNVEETPRVCLLYAVLFYSILSFIFLIFKNYLPYVITNDLQLVTNSITYMPLVILTNFFYIPSTVYKYSLQAIEDEKWVFLSSVIINFVGLLLIFLFSEVLILKLYGVYLGMTLNYIILSISFYFRYWNLVKNKGLEKA